MAVGDAINRTIDFEQSKSRHRPSVRTGIDHQLDELKRRYEGISSFLTDVVNDINLQAPEWAAQYISQCIFLPQLGFLTMVEIDPATGRGRYEGEGFDNDQWLRVFASDGCAYYKNKFMKELDENHGDTYCEIGGRSAIRQTLSYRSLF
jgi:DNA mismatch repair protein MSH5